MDPNLPHFHGSIGFLIISIVGAILSFISLQDAVSLLAGIGAIIAAAFSIRSSYYNTKISKKKLEEDEELDKS